MKKEITVVASEDQLALLDQSFPVEEENRGPRVPRIGFLSKDVTEESGTGKAKKIKVIESAGTFYKDVESEEVDPSTKKKLWEKQYITDKAGEPESLDVVIFFNRRQLRMYSDADGVYINSPVYDSPDQKIPLFKGADKIGEGTEAELRAMYPALTKKGKPTSDLDIVKILYFLYEGGIYQMSLSQSSKYAFEAYKRDVKTVSRYVTRMGMSEEMTNGSNVYRHVTFEKHETISKDQADIILPVITDMNRFIEAKQKSDAEFNDMK